MGYWIDVAQHGGMEFFARNLSDALAIARVWTDEANPQDYRSARVTDTRGRLLVAIDLHPEGEP